MENIVEALWSYIKYVERKGGELVGSYDEMISKQNVIYTDGTLVAAAATVNSGYVYVGNIKTFQVTKKHTTGTYTMSLDWSRDGTNSDFNVASLTIPSDGVAVVVTVSAPFVKFTIACTTTQFTVHRTVVFG